MDDNRVEAYWQGYLETLPADSPVRDEQYIAEGWDSPEMADELGALISPGPRRRPARRSGSTKPKGNLYPSRVEVHRP